MNDNKKIDSIYFFLLERAVRRFKKFSHREMSKRGFDISGDQWIILRRAYEQPGISQKEIANSTYKDPASVTRMIDLLEKRGLLERQDHGNDRRSHCIFLTTNGLEFVKNILPMASEMQEFGLRNVSENDKQTFVKVLNEIYNNLE